MMVIRVVNRTKGTELGNSIRLADSILSRLRGFLFRGRPSNGEGLLLSPCQAVHMVGVTFPLDVVFIDEDGRVVALYVGLEPMRRTRLHGNASHALELPPGTIASTRTEVGDGLLWTPMEDVDGIIDLYSRKDGGGRKQDEARRQA